MIDLNEMAKKCKEISKARQEHGARIDEDPLKACAGEVVEAAEARKVVRMFIDSTSNETKQNFMLDYVSELADIIICVLTASAEENFDIEGALQRKLQQNEKRALCIGDKL